MDGERRTIFEWLATNASTIAYCGSLALFGVGGAIVLNDRSFGFNLMSIAVSFSSTWLYVENCNDPHRKMLKVWALDTLIYLFCMFGAIGLVVISPASP